MEVERSDMTCKHNIPKNKCTFCWDDNKQKSIHPHLDELYTIYHKGRVDDECKYGECEWDEMVGSVYKAISQAIEAERSRIAIKLLDKDLEQVREWIMQEMKDK